MENYYGRAYDMFEVQTDPLQIKIKDEVKDKIEESLTEITEILGITGIFCFPDLWTLLTLSIIDALRPNFFFSIGLGRGLMPFNMYEAGLRFIIPFITPIRLLQYRAYTGFLKVLPGISYGDKNKCHIVTARCFRGLYIDGASLLTERFIGPTLAIGKGYLKIWDPNPLN